MSFGRQVVAKLLDIYPAHTALVDNKGDIIVVNRAWKEFGRHNGLNDPLACEHSNYLDECERARARGARGVEAVHEGIKEILRGHSDRFSYSYPCHSPTERRWFRLIAAPFSPSRNTRWAVLLHVDITHQRDLAQRYLRMNETTTDTVHVCAWCKLIRESHGAWVSFEVYFSKRRGNRFSHSICPTCLEIFLHEPRD
jgi:hypothetical protein